MRIKINIPKKVVVGVLTFLMTAGVFYGVFRMTTATSGLGEQILVSDHSNKVYYGDGWSTQQYQVEVDEEAPRTVLTSQGMCLDANLDSPLSASQVFYGTHNTLSDAQMIKIMLVTVRSYNSSIFTAFNNSYNWSSLASAVGMTYTGSDAEIFALGHILVSGSHGVYSHAQSATTQINSAINDINQFFTNNYASGYGDWTLHTYNPYNSSVQRVGWLVGSYSPDDPTPVDPTTPTYEYFRIWKYDSTTNADLAGATFVIGGTAYTTDSEGFTPCVGVQVGTSATYYELAAPSGYVRDTTVYTFVADTEISQTDCENLSPSTMIGFPNEPSVAGGVRIRKVDADNGSSSNGGSSIIGTVFGVYQSGTNAQVAELTINNDLGANGATGETAANDLPAGTYYVREKIATDGYKLDTTIPSWTFTISTTNQGMQDFSTSAQSAKWFENEIKKGDVEITKYKQVKFEEVGDTNTMAGVTFVIKRQGSSSEVTRITTNANGYAATTGSALSYGTYNLYEVADETNEAYDVDEDTAVATVVVGETDGATVTASAVTNQLRDDPTLSTEARNSEASARSDEGATEVPISTSTSVTDKVSFDSLTTGLLYKLEGELWVLDPTYANEPLSTTTKTWVHGTETYVDSVFTGVDMSGLSGKTLGIYQELYVCNGHSGTTCTGEWIKLFEHNDDLTDTDETVTVKSLGIQTSASSERLGKEKYLTAGHVTIYDTLTVTGLVNGETYYLLAQVLDEDGNVLPLLNDGGSGTFLEEEYVMHGDTGAVVYPVMELEIDATELIGKKVTVYESLLDENKHELAQHRVLGDADQTLTVEAPTIDTTAVNGANTASKTLYVSTDAVIQDTISLTGLSPNTTYTLASEVYLVETVDGVRTQGEKVLGPITTGHGFTTGNSENYSQTVSLPINTMDLAGKELVVYEYLYYGSSAQPLVSHIDPTDEDQIVTVGTLGIGTTAKDGASGETDNVIEAKTGQIIQDTVSFTGLTPGEQYYLEGVVMKKTSETTGEELVIDGTTVMATEEFTAGATGSGTVEVEFTLDASELPGEELVVYETLYQVVDGVQKTLATHKDITDGNQTIKVRPKIGTKAVDKYDGDQTIGVGNATIVDTVEYHGLKTGITYVMTGYLVLIDGTTATEIPDAIASKTFEIGNEGTEEADGEVELEFAIDTRQYAGKKIVVFEELTYRPESGGVDDALVTEHKDPNDEAQTVRIATPTIKTTAKDKMDGDKELEMNSVVIVVDEVAYAGLVPGTTYVLRGELRDKETGEMFKTNDGTEVKPAYVEFVPDRDAGSIKMEFEFDSTGLSGKEAVVFEVLYMDELPDGEEEPSFVEDEAIAKHKDLDDYAQTVWVKIVKPNTGAVTRGLDGAKARGVYAALVGILVVSVSALVGVRMHKKQRFGF